jgi:hypothetical protein
VDGWIIFEGEDFAGSPMDADDSDETVAALLTFLTLRRGDTDAEYFESYTPEQLAWQGIARGLPQMLRSSPGSQGSGERSLGG